MDTDTTLFADSSFGREDICKISEETVLCKPHSNSLSSIKRLSSIENPTLETYKN